MRWSLSCERHATLCHGSPRFFNQIPACRRFQRQSLGSQHGSCKSWRRSQLSELGIIDGSLLPFWTCVVVIHKACRQMMDILTSARLQHGTTLRSKNSFSLPILRLHRNNLLCRVAQNFWLPVIGFSGFKPNHAPTIWAALLTPVCDGSCLLAGSHCGCSLYWLCMQQKSHLLLE